MKNLVILLVCAFLLQSCAAINSIIKYLNGMEPENELEFAIGKSGIGGPNSGPSWLDPVGGSIGIETKVYEVSDNASFRVGLNVSKQGADYEETFTDEYDYQSYEESISGTVSTTYLNVPILYNYKTTGGFYAEVGLQPGYLLRARDKIEGGEGYDYKDYMKGFELGLPLGVGYQINEQLSVGARAIWGLTNNSDSGSGDKDHNYLVVGTISYNIGSLLGKDK